MTETVESVSAHAVLRSLPAAADVMRKYGSTRTLITNYDQTMRAVWMNQNVSVYDSLVFHCRNCDVMHECAARYADR